MPYQEGSSEAQAGLRGEQAVDKWARDIAGLWRLEVSNLGPAARLFGPGGQLIALDRLYVGRGITRWCDIKWKTGPVVYNLKDVMRHGIDQPNWEHYREIVSKSGIPGDLAIVEVKRHRNATEIAPRLLWASIERLERTCEFSVSDNKMVYWNRADFEDLGPIDIGPEPLPETARNLKPWELKDVCGRLRIPPNAPRQFELGFYNAEDDMRRSIEDCYRAVRERRAKGGKGWPPNS